VHTGETETIDGERGGMGVVIGARVMSLGGAGEVLVTSTTKDLVTGSGLEFEDLSAHELKGVPGTWQVFGVTRVDGRDLDKPLTAEEAVERFEQIHPAPFIKRRAKPVAAVAVTALLVVASAAFAATRHSPRAVAAASPTVTLVRIDAASNKITLALKDGVQSLHRPKAIYYDGSSLWQSTNDPPPPGALPGEPASVVPSTPVGPPDQVPLGKLIRRDPTTGMVLSTQELDTGDGLGFVFGYAWVAHYEGKHRAELEKIDPVSGNVLKRIRLPGELSDINAGPRSLWYLSSQGYLVEINPITAKIIHAPYRLVATQPSAVVPLLGYVWICDCSNGKILRFDPGEGMVTKTVVMKEKGRLLGVDSSHGNTLWLLDQGAATITPLDPSTGVSGRPLGIGGGNIFDASIGFGSIWVAAGSQVFRFDLADGTRHVIEMPAGVSAGGLALDPAHNSVWVENCGCPTQ
jgi:streptogramin lyase